MLPYRDSRLTQIALGLFFLAVLGYAYYEARGLLWGPHIFVTWGSSEVHEQYVKITGRADHISELRVDGTPISVTKDGSFEVPYLLAPGANHIMFDARDSYGHTSSKTVEIVYAPSATSTAEARPATPPGAQIPPQVDSATSTASISPNP